MICGFPELFTYNPEMYLSTKCVIKIPKTLCSKQFQSTFPRLFIREKLIKSLK